MQSLVQQEKGLLFCMAFTGLMLRGLLTDGDERLEKLEAVKCICNRVSNTEDQMASEVKKTTQTIFFFSSRVITRRELRQKNSSALEGVLLSQV